MFRTRELITSVFDEKTTARIEKAVFIFMALSLTKNLVKQRKLPAGTRLNIDTDGVVDYVTTQIGLHPHSRAALRMVVKKMVDRWQHSKK